MFGRRDLAVRRRRGRRFHPSLLQPPGSHGLFAPFGRIGILRIQQKDNGEVGDRQGVFAARRMHQAALRRVGRGVGRIEQHRVGQITQPVLVLIQCPQDGRAMGKCFGRLGIQPQGLSKVIDRVAVTALLEASHTAVAQRPGVVGRLLQEGRQVRRGIAVHALGRVRLRPKLIRLRQLIIQIERRGAIGDGGVGRLLRAQRPGAQQVGARVLRIQLDAAAEVDDRLTRLRPEPAAIHRESAAPRRSSAPVAAPGSNR